MRRVALSIFFVILSAAVLLAQYTTGSLTGTVIDASGAAVPDATITVQNTETGLTRSVRSGPDGGFVLPNLSIGTYRLAAEKAGFSTYLQEGITIAVNQAVTVSVKLKVGEVSEKVTVAANAAMITTHTATVSQLVDQERIVDLPLQGRQAQRLLFLAPGANNTTSTYCGGDNCQGGLFSRRGSLEVEQTTAVNGGGTQNVNYAMDGADHNDTYVNMNLPFPNPDAIQEFSVQSNNMSAEYGQGANVVDIVTKSGTNLLHGSAFEFLRNGALNARNFFAPVHDTLKRNQFGGTIGGPIKKDSLFFFGTYQGTRIVTASASASQFVPTQAERNGDFSAVATQLVDPVTKAPFPNNQISPSLFSSASKYFLQHIPLPNATDGRAHYTTAPNREHYDEFMPKVDWIRGKNQLSGRYFYSRYSLPPADPSLVNANSLVMNFGQNVKVQTVAVNDAYTATPTLLFSTWFGWNAQTGGNVPGAPFDFKDAGINLPRPPGPRQFDGLSVGGWFSFSGLHPGDFDRGDKTFREVVMLQKGTHELHFGGQVLRVNLNLANQYEQEGFFRFSNDSGAQNLVDFLLGQNAYYEAFAGQYTNNLGTFYSLFIQDNWRVSPKLTLNLGLRWDPFWPYTETQNAVACYVPGAKSARYPNAPVGLIYGGDPGCPAGTSQYSNLFNLAPRLGFAYRIGEKTVLRGGAGIYYIDPQTTTISGITQTPPFSPAVSFQSVSFMDPFGSAGVPNPFPAAWGIFVPGPDAQFLGPPFDAVGLLQPHLPMPEMGTANLTLERQVGTDWLFSAAYVGTFGWKLYSGQNGILNLNPAVYGPGATRANTQSRRLNPAIGRVLVFDEHNSNYNALQLNVKKRFLHGLSLWANYTWSHNLDNYPGSPGSCCAQRDSFSRAIDYGNSLDNLPNVFHFSAVWDMPKLKGRLINTVLGNWELAPIITWQNGLPFTISSGVDNSFSGNNADQADFVGTSLSQAVLGDQSHGEKVLQAFNTSLFKVNAPGTYGNTGKTILQGPGLFQTDFGVLKNFAITEAKQLQFRSEFFNFFNNVNFGQPGATVGTPGFGKIFSARDPRIIQFGLKFMF